MPGSIFCRRHRNSRRPSLSDLLRKRVNGTIGHGGHRLRANPEQCARLMTQRPRRPALRRYPCDGWQRGLYSTGNDMALWLRHNIEDADGTLALSHAIYRQRQALPAAIGFDEAARWRASALAGERGAQGIHPALMAKSGGALVS